jgi:aminoglycoside 3-N-acetyltransferase
MSNYDPAGRLTVTQADITAGLRSLGLQPGDVVQVHSSLSRLGYVEGGADAVVDAFLEVVGPEGTVMVPTFNHGKADLYDRRTTPSISGAITEALRKRPESRRSIHPTHPYAAIGRHAEHLVAGHLEVDTFDPLSPLGKLAELGGWVLLLGIGMVANTAAHIGEFRARVPCIGFNKWPRQVLGEDGRTVRGWSVIWRNGPCRIEWEPLEERMRSQEMIRYGRIGEGDVRLMKAKDVIDTTYTMTQEEPYCPTCPVRPIPVRYDTAD